MPPLLNALRESCRLRLPKPALLLVAVSGGPDSVALLLGLYELREECGLRLTAAHVNHGWRGADADADADWVADLGRRLDVPTEILTVTSAQRDAVSDQTLEEGARDIRYRLLIESARRHECQFVALGHTADDQVETVLHHILRGTGVAGLAGMPAERELAEGIRLLRPLLALSRSTVLAYLSERGQTFRTDSTNADVALTRNRLRAEVLPLLRERFNPQVDAALLRLAEQAGEAAAVIEELSQRLLADVLLTESATECRLDVMRLAREPLPLVREAFRQLWIRRGWPRQEMGRREWQRLADLAQRPGATDLPGRIHAQRTTGALSIRQEPRTK